MKCAFSAIALVASVIFIGSSGTIAAQKPKTQWDGVYTEVQSKRGVATYATSCARCHGADLSGGDFGPPLTGSAFTANWNDMTLDNLVERILGTMPQDSPGSLSRAQTVDIVALVLKKNGAPAGKTGLAVQPAALKQITFSPKKK